jgi:hypothetical protein
MKPTTNTAPETPAVTETPPTGETPAQGIALKKLCQELKMDPKKARRLLRRAWRKEGQTELSHNIRERWAGDDAFIAKMRAILAPTKH